MRYAFSSDINPAKMISPSNQIVLQDHHVPMNVEKPNERDAVLEVLWLDNSEQNEIKAYVINL
jgi:hypothetical protein